MCFGFCCLYGFGVNDWVGCDNEVGFVWNWCFVVWDDCGLIVVWVWDVLVIDLCEIIGSGFVNYNVFDGLFGLDWWFNC